MVQRASRTDFHRQKLASGTVPAQRPGHAMRVSVESERAGIKQIAVFPLHPPSGGIPVAAVVVVKEFADKGGPGVA